MPEHVCYQEGKFTEIADKIDKVGKDLHDHRIAQQKQTELHDERVALKSLKDDEFSNQLNIISNQIAELLILNTEIKDFKTAWRVGKNLGIGLAIFITTLSVIFGGTFAIKEWIKK